MDDQWPAIARFGEMVCGTLGCADVQQRGLPDVARLTHSDSGSISLIDRQYRRTLSTSLGPLALLYEFDEISWPCEYLRRSIAAQSSIHDGMIHESVAAHRRSSQGRVLAHFGLEHCMVVPLIRNGRAFGSIALARQSGRAPFSAADRQIADRLARFVSLAIANAAVYEAAAGPTSFEETVSLKTATRVVEVQTIRLSPELSIALHAQRRSKVTGLDATLTARELEVFELVSSGLTNIEIAAELSIALNTVKQHLKHIYRKLGARSRFEAMRNSERSTLPA